MRTAERSRRPEVDHGGHRRPGPRGSGERSKLRLLVGSGDRIGLFVLPFLVVGIALYVASRRYSPAEEAELAGRFGPVWYDYCRAVWLPWL